MQEWSGLRSAAVLHGVYPHQYRGKGDACAQGASKVACSEAAYDSPVMNHIHNRTVVGRLRESPPRAHSTCTSTVPARVHPYSAYRIQNTEYIYFKTRQKDDKNCTSGTQMLPPKMWIAGVKCARDFSRCGVLRPREEAFER